MTSKYWDDFEKREIETVQSLNSGNLPPVRRVAIYITEKCNFNCVYCNMKNVNNEMPKEVFENIVNKYGKSAILHITGGEPSTVNWLYDYIESGSQKFNLNTNAYIAPPAKNIDRLKISFDTQYEHDFNKTVRKIAFQNVVDNIKISSKTATVSLTCVLSKQTFLNTLDLARFVNNEFPNVYALFFSFYKGDNLALKMNDKEIDYFFDIIRPKLLNILNKESKELLLETLTHKFRIQEGIRFPENSLDTPCYLSMSERVIGPDGIEYNCSHLFRDKVFKHDFSKHSKCLYGCNTRLAKFNTDVKLQLTSN